MSGLPASATVLTVRELAARIGVGRRRAAELLRLFGAEGLATEIVPGGWRLTPSAETRFGPALRSLIDLDAGLDDEFVLHRRRRRVKAAA